PPHGRRSRAKVYGAALGIVTIVGSLTLALRFGGREPANFAGVSNAAPSAMLASAGTSAPRAAPAVREEVDVRIDGAPLGATVYANGVEAGTAPGPFKLKIGVPVKLAVTANGYKTKELTITPTDNVLVPVTLDKVPVGGPRVPASKGTTIHSD